MSTAYHAKYFAHELTRRRPSDSVEKLAVPLSDAQVDLNPHQVEAALFAFRSPLSKGAILADEVGLGKTIEAGILISQQWAERKRCILIIVPASLRKQWSQELLDKFFLPSVILETKSFNEAIKTRNLNPFEQDKIVICSYQFAKSKSHYIAQTDWSLVVIDEAHKLRNVYKSSSKIASILKTALTPFRKVLLTATPLQNSLLELYGLVSIIDDFTFGDLQSFKSQFTHLTNQDSFDELKARLKPICKRTLRRQVLEYVKYTNRIALVQEFYPTSEEQKLYDLVSSYLQREDLFALPKGQRKLMTLILRRLLASSTFAISGTLSGLAEKLQTSLAKAIPPQESSMEIAENFETYGELVEEWSEGEEDNEDTEALEHYSEEDIKKIKLEISELQEFSDLAKSIIRNSKGDVLLTALKRGLSEARTKGAPEKAIIFTESTRTQSYILNLLENSEFKGKAVLFNGSNNDSQSKSIYNEWIKLHAGTDRITGSPTADKRAALVDYFRNQAVIMIATEAAAEGINLQFCSLVVNYDMPWNPQRIEQRIGRCHRYGQKYDVVVVNFLNKSNEADQRVYQLLDEKFKLFSGVFGASDEVLGAIESGTDFERRIIDIYQKCRTLQEIQLSFDRLQQELGSEIDESLKRTRQQLLENFDEEVQEKLRIRFRESKEYLGRFENWLWSVTEFFLEEYADFKSDQFSFRLRSNPFPEEVIHPGPYRLGRNVEDVNIYRIGHPLAQRIIAECKAISVPTAQLTFDLSGSDKRISVLNAITGKAGWLYAKQFTLSSFEIQDEILLAGITDDGDMLDDEQCQRLFSLPASVSSDYNEGALEHARPILAEHIKTATSKFIDALGLRNSEYFQNELDKLDGWADDQRNSHKQDIRDIEDQIKTIKKQSRLAPNLPEKLSLEKERRNLETKRDELWRKYEMFSREIEQKKDGLIDEVERRMQEQISEQELFMIRWHLV